MRQSRLRRRRLVLVPFALLAVVVATAVPALARSDSTTRPVKRVQANNYYFCNYSAPSCSSSDTNHRTHVVVGTRVRWIYKDAQCTSAYPLCPGHNVKVQGHPASQTVYTRGTVIKSMVFRSVGTFHYWCTHHRGQGMTGRIVVTRH